MAEFFVSCLPHFEDELANELSEFWCYLLQLNARPQTAALEIKKSGQGGVYFEAPIELGLQVNFFSKISHRVLLRVKKFKVKDENRLFYQLREIDWSPYFKEMTFACEVASSQSRLSNEKQILDIACKAWGLKSIKEGKVYIRLHEDECVVSVDTTGEHLHMRNLRKRQGPAPLRETVSAYCIRKLIHDTSANELIKIKLIDPMAGAGTFLLEAIHLYLPNQYRNFSFQKFPITPKLLLSASLFSNYPIQRTFGSFEARDISQEMVSILEQNLISLNVKILCQDILKPSPIPEGRVWVAMNPPYGERISGPEWNKLILKASENLKPERMGVLLPSHFQPPSLLETGLKLKEIFKLKNAGIHVQWLIYEDPKSSIDFDEKMKVPHSEAESDFVVE